MNNTNIEFNVTDSAINRIVKLVSLEKKKDAKLRVSVEAGGCSGFQYKYEFVSEIEVGDHVIEKNGAKILIDEVSLEFLQGGQLDYVVNLGGEYFEIKNPNASKGCGCGNSFSV